jgi:hypothetical protein
VKWNLSVILIWISFMGKYVDYFFMFTGHNYFERCPYNSLVHLLIGLFILLLVSF